MNTENEAGKREKRTCPTMKGNDWYDRIVVRRL